MFQTPAHSLLIIPEDVAEFGYNEHKKLSFCVYVHFLTRFWPQMLSVLSGDSWNAFRHRRAD